MAQAQKAPAKQDSTGLAPSPGKKGAKAKIIHLTPDLKALNTKLQQAHVKAERSLSELYELVDQADKAKLFAAYKFKNMTEYLIHNIGVEKRTAQHMVSTVQSFRQVGMGGEDYEQLGVTASRTIGSLVRRGNMKPREAAQFIDKYKKEGWNIERLEQEARKELTRRRVASGGRGADASEEIFERHTIATPPSRWEAIEQSCKRIAKFAGTKDIGACIELGLANSTAGLADDPDEQMKQASGWSQAVSNLLEEHLAAAAGLSDGNQKEQKKAEQMRKHSADLATQTVFAMGNYVVPDDVDAKAIRDQITRKDDTKAGVVIDRAEMLFDTIGVVAGLKPADLAPIRKKLDALRPKK